jgi:hypothetical protein
VNVPFNVKSSYESTSSFHIIFIFCDFERVNVITVRVTVQINFAVRTLERQRERERIYEEKEAVVSIASLLSRW